MDAGVEKVLRSFTDAATKAFGGALRSIVLFGSAAEDRLRPVSDVNVLVVLATFDPAAAERLRDELRLARAAVALRPMFVTEAELPDAVELFATKFADIRRRHRVLVGDDPFDKITVSRAARIRSLRRALLNLSMRLRERFASVADGGHAVVLAEFVPTVRTSAAEWLALRDGAAPAPRDAVLQAARELGGDADAEALATASTAREGGDVEPAHARDALLRLSALVGRLATAAAGLAP